MVLEIIIVKMLLSVSTLPFYCLSNRDPQSIFQKCKATHKKSFWRSESLWKTIDEYIFRKVYFLEKPKTAQLERPAETRSWRQANPTVILPFLQNALKTFLQKTESK